MPFSVEDKRVLCHTKYASRTHGILSGAEWVLSSPVMPPNPNYKIKMHVTSMQIPNSFEHVSSKQKNDTLYIIRKWDSESITSAVLRDSYLKINIATKDGHIANVRDYFESLETLEKAINNEIMAVMRSRPAYVSSRFAPQFRINKKGYPLQFVREVFGGTTEVRDEFKFDEDDTTEIVVSDGIENISNIVKAKSLEDVVISSHPVVWSFNTYRFDFAESSEEHRMVRSHKEPFFLFAERDLNVQGFGFVIKGSDMKGILPKSKKAYFKSAGIYDIKKSTGFYDIYDDGIYAVVACPSGENTPIPEFNPNIDENIPAENPDDSRIPYLQKGTIRILELNWREAGQGEKQRSEIPNTQPFTRAYMLGNALLSSLFYTDFGIPEILERQKQQQDKWFINGFDLFEDQTLENSAHLHCWDIRSYKEGDKSKRINRWTGEGGGGDPYFDDTFKTWYNRWAVHLYDSITAPDTVMANYVYNLPIANHSDPSITRYTGYIQRINYKNQPVLEPIGKETWIPTYVYPRSFYGTGPYMAYEWKLVTDYDIQKKSEGVLEIFQGGLAEMIGYTRFAYTPGVNVPNTDIKNELAKIDSIVPRRSGMPVGTDFSSSGAWRYFVVAQAPCDFSGVRFVKVYTNMNVSAIDADGKDSRLVAIVPTVGTAAMESNYMVGALQGSQTFSLGDTKIDRIRFDLTDDKNVPLEMYRDWWIDITFSFEEPFSVDFYQGISNLINIGTRFTTEGYKFNDYSTITRDVGDEMDRLNSVETRNRRNNSDMGTKRKHGHGGY